jgi:hypothetical protein
MLFMKYIIGLLCVIGVSTVSAASDATSLIGTWKGFSNAAIIGVDEHHDTKALGDAKFVKTEFTHVIEQAEGLNLSGHLTSYNRTEKFIGAMRPGMKSGVIVDEDGSLTFDILSENVMTICYSHPPSTGKSAVAACGEFRRQ